MTNWIPQSDDDIYVHDSGNIAVRIDEEEDVAHIWCNVESSAETERVKAENRDWLMSVFDIYGIDYRDAEFHHWIKAAHPRDGRGGISDVVRL